MLPSIEEAQRELELRLEKGRPVNEAGRLEKEIKAYNLLDRIGISFERIDHEPLYTMEACDVVAGILNASICKNLFLCNTQKTQFYMLLLPGDKKFKTKVVSKLLGVARLSFGDEEHMEGLLDLTPGSVTILGLMNDTERKVKLIIDKDVMDAEYFACHPCINTSSIRFKMEDLVNKLIPALGHEPVYLDYEPEEE